MSKGHYKNCMEGINEGPQEGFSGTRGDNREWYPQVPNVGRPRFVTLSYKALSCSCDFSGNTVAFTLWNEQATSFPVNLCRQIEQPPIIAVSSCYNWAKRFGCTY